MIYFIGNEPLIISDKWNVSTVDKCLEYFKSHEFIAVDTETTGKDWNIKKIICLQIGDDKNQFVIDTRVVDILLFKNLLESTTSILHNAKFDYKFLKASGIILNKTYDTMLVEAVLYCGYLKYGYSLANLCERYLNITLDKSTRGEFFKLKDEEFSDDQIIYAALDVTYLHQIKDLQLLKVEEYDLEYCINIENEVYKALADIEYNGMFLNAEKWKENTNNYQIELDALGKQLDDVVLKEPKLSIMVPQGTQGNLFGWEERTLRINYASPSQIQKICKALGYYVDSTNDRELTKLASKHEFFKILQEYREKAKIISTYGEGFLDYINSNTGRVHTSFWQVLNTFRVSSGSKDDNAPNLQNLPAQNKFRNCFEARQGFKWISIDYSGQELCIMADGSGEKGFIDVLNRGDDLHCYAGEMMFKRPIDKKKDKDLRDKAKTINFGKPYGMGPPKLADTLGISIEEAEELFIIYRKAFPDLNKWLESQAKFAKLTGYAKAFPPAKGRRWFPLLEKAKELRKLNIKDKEIWKEIFMIEGEAERCGMNMPIQSTGAFICKEALIEVRNLIRYYNSLYKEEIAFLICTVHDAIDVEVREDLADKFAKDMEEVMIKCGNKYVSKVQMRVDTTITDYWTK